MILGIDASTPGSGGAKRHLIELLKAYDTTKHQFEKIKIWGVQSLLDELPNNEYIIKISHPLLNGNFVKRTIWQFFYRDKSIKNECDILFSPFGTYIGKIRPYVSMSRNMLVFDKNERKRFGFSLTRLKLKLLFYTQKKSFNGSAGIVFLSTHAQSTINRYVKLQNINTKVIHHGVSKSFDSIPKNQHPLESYNFEKPYKFLYVSTIWVYKHPWNIALAIKNLRNQGYPISLTIIGNSEQKSAGDRLAKIIKEVNTPIKMVSWHQKIGLSEIAEYYKKSDAFIFASTCENMPNILIEAMASGLPIACSSYNPMPEFLIDGGLYFNPENISSIEDTIKSMIVTPTLRAELAKKSYNYSKKFSWDKCADETLSFIYNICVK